MGHSTRNVTSFFRTVPIVPETNGRVAEIFVSGTARVERGQAIGIVEAMKVMNEVASDATGVVAEILVPDGQPVEFEQPLIVIDTKT